MKNTYHISVNTTTNFIFSVVDLFSETSNIVSRTEAHELFIRRFISSLSKLIFDDNNLSPAHTLFHRKRNYSLVIFCHF